MADFVDINDLTLGTTFGGWYAKNNVMIQRLNALNVANIIGGDGITASPHTAANGGYTLSLSGTVTRNMVFDGNVTVNGTLISNFAGDISGTTIILPANTGVTLGNIVYIDNTGKVQKALADDECTAEVVGIVTGFTGGNAQIATTGKISGSSIISAFTGTPGATLQKGVVYFLSGGVSGAGTTFEPDVTLYVSKPMLLGLTGDSGLILPYRGFIATEGTVGNTTVIQGVCGGSVSGVLSVNGLTASIFKTNQLPGNRKTTGHIHAVNYIVLSDNLPNVGQAETQAVKITPYSYQSDITSSGTIASATRQILTKGPGAAGSAGDNYQSRTLSEYPSNVILFSTLGLMDDVYKLHRIRIINNSGIYKLSPINFVLTKSYNNLGASSYTSSDISGIPHAFNSSYIEYTMKNYTIVHFNPLVNGFQNIGLNNSSLGAQGSNTLQKTIESLNFLTPVSRRLPAPYASTAPTGITTSSNDGTLTTSGVYPTIPRSNNPALGDSSIGDDNYLNRVNAWTFTNAIAATTAISGYLDAIKSGNGFSATSSTAGATLESAVLGWNAHIGATPETIAILFPSLDNSFNIDTKLSSYDTTINVCLELYRYNPTNGVTGPIMLITKDLFYKKLEFVIEGTPAVYIGGV